MTHNKCNNGGNYRRRAKDGKIDGVSKPRSHHNYNTRNNPFSKDILPEANCPTMSGLVLHRKLLNRLEIPVMKRGKSEEGSQKHNHLIVSCKKRRGKESLEESSMISGKWENLHPDILREIFRRVPVVDLFVSVSSVCQSWEAVCWDFMFWSHKILDMSATGAGFGMFSMLVVETLQKRHLPPRPIRAPGFFGVLDSRVQYNNMVVTLMIKLRSIMEREILHRSFLQSWRISITTVVIPYDLEISDMHLLYIAERTPSVQHLKLLCLSRITVGGFVQALQCWKHLRVIHLGPLNDDGAWALFITRIGENCRDIESLHIHEENFRLDDRNAYVIAQSLPGIKKLGLDSGVVTPSGVTTLYNLCLQLEELCFRQCHTVHDIEALTSLPRSILSDFRLSWTTDEWGFVEWKCAYIFDYEMADELTNSIVCPQFLADMNILSQSFVDEWMFCPSVSPRLRGVHS